MTKPKVGFFGLTGCAGDQLAVLNCEDELLAVAGEVEIANFPEATRALVKGPYDLSLVEGSITTPHDAERIHQVRRASKKPTAGWSSWWRECACKDGCSSMAAIYTIPL